MIAEGRNIVVTGMMGTGKSRVGCILAAALGREFRDTDALIIEREGRPITEIFAAAGEAHFRSLEVELCRELARHRNLVIATGGGTLVRQEGRQALGRDAIVVCLRGNPRTLADRVADDDSRPLLQGQDPQTALERLWNERRNAYALAPLQVETDGRTPEEVSQEILRALQPAPSRLERIPVAAPPGNDYHVWLGLGALRLLPGLVSLPRSRQVTLVADRAVPESFAREVLAAWEEAGCRAAHIPLEIDEEKKTLATVEALYGQFLKVRVDRGSLVLALGGGVLSDLAGFASATFMRGVPFIPLPTTLLAAVDASVGGKTGVNLPQGKNLVGAFWPPAAVALDPTTFYTLPDVEIENGLAETLKAAVIDSPQLFAHLETQGLDRLGWIVAEAIRVKARIVALDLREQGPRALLNLGHTFGHAFEVLSGYRLPHGQAVATGMVVAARLGEVLGLTSRVFVARLLATMSSLGLPTRPPDLPFEDLWEAMQTDKKRRGQSLPFVVPADVGQVRVVEGVPPDDVRAAWERSQTE